MTQHQKRTITIFCRVVDNLGDIGVTWRLSRQLVHEKNCVVRLVVDDLLSFRKIAPEIDPSLKNQRLDGIEVLHWDEESLATYYAASGNIIGDVVIEAFACALPDFFVQLMVQQKKIVWIDLEYLSAEDWIEDCHAVISCHPSTGLNKTLFFPGFTPRTGGLFRAGNLLQERDTFQGSIAMQDKWRESVQLPVKSKETLDISLFCYDFAPVSALLSGLQGRSVRIFTLPEIAALLLQHDLGGIQIFQFDYMPQEDFSRLLWTCDLNFVRGEDSFLQALWAARPYIWQIYVQAEDAHLVKLDAFLSRYSENLDPQSAETLAEMSGMWNLRGHNKDSVQKYLDALPRFAEYARQKAAEQAKQDDLATRLLRFIEDNL